MTRRKRLFDLVVGVLMALLVAPVLIGLLFVVLIREGRPVLHASERMKGRDHAFWMWKIRTMEPDAQNDEIAGGHNAARVTNTGRWLRKRRLDELPQIWNVLKGDMTLVGPRPPLRRYVARFPVLYEQVLASRPGVTSLAALNFVPHEERLLARCMTSSKTDEVYEKFCVRRKAQVDLIYQKHGSLLFDLCVIWRTGVAFFGGFSR